VLKFFFVRLASSPPFALASQIFRHFGDIVELVASIKHIVNRLPHYVLYSVQIVLQLLHVVARVGILEITALLLDNSIEFNEGIRPAHRLYLSYPLVTAVLASKVRLEVFGHFLKEKKGEALRVALVAQGQVTNAVLNQVVKNVRVRFYTHSRR